jgi:hypothetical protein
MAAQEPYDPQKARELALFQTTLTWIIKTARHTSSQARGRNAWNYDRMENTANDAVATAFDDFADLLQLVLDGQDLPEEG